MENPQAGSRERAPVDEGMFVAINGLDQWITIRGRDQSNPALLIVSGPGTAFSRMAPFFAPWEKDFTLVQWDQPGAGATHAKNSEGATGLLTLERLTHDAIAVAEFVCAHLGVSRIIVLGVSGGSAIGLMMARHRPDLLHAYVGTGQIVNWARQDSLSYAMLLARARAHSDAEAIAELERIGPPPYAEAATDAVKSKYAGALTPAEQAAFASLDLSVIAAMNEPPADARYIAKDLPLHDAHAVAMAAYSALRNELMRFDARGLGLAFDVPLFFFQGDGDAYTVTSEVQGYEAELHAPTKRIAPLEGGGHSAVFLRDEFLDLLKRHVRPLIAGTSPAQEE